VKRLDADAVVRVLEQAREPLDFDELAARLGGGRSRERREISRQLVGMVRNGELLKDHRGAYHLPAPGAVQRGVLALEGRDLMFAGLPVSRERGSWLRPGDDVEVRIVDGEARVVKVIARAEAPLYGILRTHTRYPYVDSLSPEYRGRISLVDPPIEGQEGDTVAVRVLDEDRRGLVGIVLDVHVRAGGAGQAAETLLASFDVPLAWPEAAERQTDRLPKRVNAGAHPDRHDLAALPLVTIDGETAQDYDDAVYAEKQRGGWRVVVAIADVAHYVKAGSPLDESAWERGTSVYLPDRVVPMLPEALSNDLCSLKPRVPRLAVVCDMKISHAGKLMRFEFYEAVIRSWERLTYTRVQEFLDTGALDVPSEVSASLDCLKQAYQALRAAREARGGLDFDTHASRLELEAGRVVAIHPETRLEAHRLIEEAMIAANVAAATFLERAGVPALYRVHEAPTAEKVDQLRQAFAYAGVRIGRGDVTPRDVCAALQQLGDVSNRWLYEFLVLRSLTQAVYSPENRGHFGLALERYMHFTSPIRRYPDLVVHRAIKSVLAGTGAPFPMDYLVVTGQQASSCERRADEVSWGVDAWLKCEYVADRRGESFDGVVMGVTEFGLFVELTGFYVQGLLHVSELGSDYFQYRPQSMALVGERSGRRFALGDAIRVVLRDAVPEQGRLDLVPAAPEPRSDAGGRGGRRERGDRAGSGRPRAEGRRRR